jgi:DNA primase
MDAIRLMVSGVTNVVALQGTAMTTEQISLLKKLRAKVILCLDNDNAGLLATANNGEELVKNGVETFVIRLSGEKDPDEYIVANGKEAFLENLEHPLTFFEFKMNYLKQNKDLSKVEDLADYVNAVLKDLGESNDPILREVTLSKLSQEYNLSMDVLKSKLDKKEIVLEKKEEIKKEDNSKKDLYAMGTEKILFFMMNGEEYVSRYQQKLGYFAEEKYRNIANEIVYYLNENGEITVADFITYIQDKDEIKSHVMEIVNDSINDEVTMEAMDDYILAVSKVMTKNEINRLKVMMKKELDVDKKMKYAAQIAELKKRMCE